MKEKQEQKFQQQAHGEVWKREFFVFNACDLLHCFP